MSEEREGGDEEGEGTGAGPVGRALWAMERTWASTLREVGALGAFKA